MIIISHIFAVQENILKIFIKNNVKKSDDIMLNNSPYQKLFCSLHSLVDDEIISEMNCL